jgi:hypothetical protein
MVQKLAALYSYHCQMVLTLDEFVAEARTAGVDEAQLAQINPEEYRPWIEQAIRARNGQLGAEIGVAYAEAFRYESVEVPSFFQDTTMHGGAS